MKHCDERLFLELGRSTSRLKCSIRETSFVQNVVDSPFLDRFRRFNPMRQGVSDQVCLMKPMFFLDSCNLAEDFKRPTGESLPNLRDIGIHIHLEYRCSSRRRVRHRQRTEGEAITA